MNLRAGGLRFTCVLAGLLCAGTALAAPPWSMGAPIVTYNNYSPRGYQLKDQPCGYNRALEAIYGWPKDYDPTVLTDAVAEHAVAGGFNLVWVNEPSQVRIAEAHGLRAQLILSGPCLAQNNIYATNNEAYPDKCTKGNWQFQCWPAPGVTDYLDRMIDTFKASPAAYSYYLADEPCEYIEGGHDTCGSKLQLLGAISDYVRKRDPAHLVYVNLLPPTSRITDIDAHSRYPDYNGFLDDYVSKVRPVLLSFDSYNLKYSDTGRALDDIHFITDTQLFARASVRHGIPFMAIVQGMSIGHTIRVPTAGELAFIANTTLAFGAQGISYFNYWRGLEATNKPWACKGGPFCGGLAPFPDGSPTPVYRALQSLNPMFSRTAARLRGLEWMGLYLKGYARPPADVAALPANAPFDIPALRNDRNYSSSEALRGAFLGMFGTAKKARFAYVVNLDYSAGHLLRVTGPGPLARYDTATETWIRSGSSSISVQLGPGQGALVGQAADAAALPPLAAGNGS